MTAVIEKSIAAALIALTLIGSGYPMAAKAMGPAPQSVDINAGITVRFAGLDLSKPEGVATLYGRISQAARDICGPSGVPARTSSFAYKGRPTDVRQVARDLGVSTVLEGSVRTPATAFVLPPSSSMGSAAFIYGRAALIENSTTSSSYRMSSPARSCRRLK